MKGTVTPKRSRRKRLTMPLRPRICWKATAPTKGGMTSGRSPRVVNSERPGKL